MKHVYLSKSRVWHLVQIDNQSITGIWEHLLNASDVVADILDIRLENGWKNSHLDVEMLDRMTYSAEPNLD